MEIPVYRLDEVSNYSDFTKVMRNILGVEKLRDPLTGRSSRLSDDDYLNDEIVRFVVNPD